MTVRLAHENVKTPRTGMTDREPFPRIFSRYFTPGITMERIHSPYSSHSSDLEAL